MDAHFPKYPDSEVSAKIADLERLLERDLTATRYMAGKAAARLLGVILRSFCAASESEKWSSDEFLARSRSEDRATPLMLAAAFDLVANMEYLHGRMASSNWIYCHRDSESPRAYYSFLKQCPKCCLIDGLSTTLQGAQHKPSSHHIGEITTTLTGLILQLITAASPTPLTVATISKQSHDVDAVGFDDDTLLLFEIKSSPMVSFPLVAPLSSPMVQERNGERQDYSQHSLVDLTLDGRTAGLFIPHRGVTIDLGVIGGGAWPYEPAESHFAQPEEFLEYLSAWLELFYAYSVPKTARSDQEQRLSYLVNGWGDQIDSNKTKPGLGRTDDIKKGTYQLIKFDAYYRDDDSALRVRSALVANLDPLFLRDAYITRLADIRWGHGADFVAENDDFLRIRSNHLRYLYDGILALNQPLMNDSIVGDALSLDSFSSALAEGSLDSLIHQLCFAGE